MSNVYRGPSIDASYQVSDHLVMWFQRRRFLEIDQSENKNRLWWPCLLMDRDGMSNVYRGPSIDASYQVSDHLVMWFQRRRFLEIDQSEKKNCLWWPCLLMDRDGMSNLYRGPSIDTSYQFSDHLAMWFQRRRIKKYQPIRNKNRLWWSYLLMDRVEISNLYRGPSIDASY